MRADGTIAVDAAGVNDALRNTQFTAVRVKDAIADRFRERVGGRPSVDTTSPDLRVNVVVAGQKARIAIDLSGDPLHRRGYRTPGVQVVAPMKETLAAAMLEVAGWRDIAADGGGFLDPLCGSATIVIEAAMVAGDVAPGLLRSSWGFDGWLGHDSDAWERLLDEADDRCETGLTAIPPVHGSDADAAAISIANECVKRAGLAGRVGLAVASLADAAPAAGTSAVWSRATLPTGSGSRTAASPGALSRAGGTGHRQGAGVGTRRDRLARSYRRASRCSRSACTSSTTGAFWRRSRFRPGSREKGRPATSAAAPVAAMGRIRVLRLREPAEEDGEAPGRVGAQVRRDLLPDLRRRSARLQRCDRPVREHRDRERYAHIAEYAPPAGVDAERAAARLQWASAATAQVLGIAGEDVFVKSASASAAPRSTSGSRAPA